MRITTFAAASLLCLSMHGIQHIVNTADFVLGLNTNGWRTSDTSWTSPNYPAAVESFVLSGTHLAEGATFGVTYSGGSFTISAVNGAQLTSFTANYTLTNLEPPQGLAITNVVEGSFHVTWAPVVDATGYLLQLYTNRIDGATSGIPLFDEKFSRVPSKGSSTALDPATFSALTDTSAAWGLSACYYGITPNVGVIQIGSSSKPGYLSLPAPILVQGKDNCTLEVSARRFNATTAADMPITCVTANGETNLLGVLTLTEESASRYLPLPTLVNGDTLYFHSATNKKDGRIALEGIRILEGHSTGTAVLAPFMEITTTACRHDFQNLPIVKIAARVTALAADAKDNSQPSPPVVLDLANPPRMHVLRAFPLSLCPDGVYAENFSALSNITAKTSWYNGIWPLPYWMGHNDREEPVGTIGLATTSATTSGFFSFLPATGIEKDRALGFRGSSERDFHYGIAFLNDTSTPRNHFTISYVGVQWNHRNTVAMANTFEYLVTNELVNTAAPGSWTSVPALDFAPPCTTTIQADQDEWWGDTQSATLKGVTLGVGQYLIIRWTDARSPSSGGVGVSNFRLSSERLPLTSCIIIR
ncbi:MAG: hypothetical protein MJ240_00880 [Kiritimatiellae bacterium]|nr:hypothetical protein [Kiritimatiellia bacterium]